MTSSSRPSSLTELIRGSWRILLKEVTAFGAVGVVAFCIDLGVYIWLAPHGALQAKAISSTLSTTFAYIGNKYLSFSHRARTTIRRETAFFFGINLVTLIFSLLALALFKYGFGFGHASRTLLVVNLVTIVIGTVFRFWSYKRFVFLHPDRVHEHDVDLDVELAE